MAIVKKLPASEVGASVTHTTADGTVYHVSQNPVAAPGKRFTLWKIVPGGYEKLAAADDPYELYDKMV